ncbi:MAG TPA: aspartate--tRNA(Asn) ligase [Candidatus Paceibacterota bacterium]|nr:aspartate--tRNA(Asn) ligase [Candidatus Paceibacterota bacterium]
MINRTLTRDVSALSGSIVTVAGFAHAIRDQKRMQFVVLRDHTGMIQLCHEKKEGDPLGAAISALTQESAIIASGKVVANPSAKLGGVEIVLDSIEDVGPAEQLLPITAESGLDLQLDWRALSIRRPENTLIFKVQTALEQGMRQFWLQNGFMEIHSPKLMGTASESGAELFQLDYFGGKATLAQSPQFYKQMAMAAGLDRIFEIGPVFRANPSFTARHDTEFTSVDVEMSWIESHEDVMALEERLIAYALGYVQKECGDEIKRLTGIDVVVPMLPFPRIPLAEARAILAERGHAIAHKEDLDPPGERMLAEYIKEKTGHEFVFVTDYPVEVRPFYHRRHEDDPTLTKSFDLLWHGLEVTTGAQREHRVDVLSAQAAEKGIPLESIKHYIDFFRYGCPPHGGFGLGLTRLLMILLDRKNVREVTYLYRGPTRLVP